MDVNEELKFLWKFKKFFFFFFFFLGGGGRGRGRVGGGQGGCDRRIEVFVQIQKKKLGGGDRVGGVRVDVNEELKFFGKFKKKNKKKNWGGGGGGGSGGGVSSGGGSGWM